MKTARREFQSTDAPRMCQLMGWLCTCVSRLQWRRLHGSIVTRDRRFALIALAQNDLDAQHVRRKRSPTFAG
ncbi:MAG TPA: hypothetical protein VHU84_05450, partial [Lacipirellulaceae bacterium]|nr:hypothetical protein [Lacipirellulaceae bacterium]